MTPGEPPHDPPSESPGKPRRPHCAGTQKNGGICIGSLSPGKTYCYNHDPELAEARAKAGAIRRQPGDPGTELGTLEGIARRTAKVLADLESFAETEDPDTLETVFIPYVEPARANAMIGTLRLLAALVAKREQLEAAKRAASAKGKGGDESSPFGLEDIA